MPASKSLPTRLLTVLADARSASFYCSTRDEAETYNAACDALERAADLVAEGRMSAAFAAMEEAGGVCHDCGNVRDDEFMALHSELEDAAYEEEERREVAVAEMDRVAL